MLVWLELQLWCNLNNAQWSMHLLTYLQSTSFIFKGKPKHRFRLVWCHYNLSVRGLVTTLSNQKVFEYEFMQSLDLFALEHYLPVDSKFE